jgi:hypothetical protein
MTVRDAKNLLILDGYRVTKVREGIYQVDKNWFIEVIGEQELVDRARELDKTPQPTFEQGGLG